mmetsp:Transcript_8954/g.14224  ORF Transcript_8954/g.14224 Transcript_8954/m.14224 type:complete len:223 (-) Transcript_8954:365-1033(-)
MEDTFTTCSIASGSTLESLRSTRRRRRKGTSSWRRRNFTACSTACSLCFARPEEPPQPPSERLHKPRSGPLHKNRLGSRCWSLRVGKARDTRFRRRLCRREYSSLRCGALSHISSTTGSNQACGTYSRTASSTVHQCGRRRMASTFCTIASSPMEESIRCVSTMTRSVPWAALVGKCTALLRSPTTLQRRPFMRPLKCPQHHGTLSSILQRSNQFDRSSSRI